jgi:enediyne biosynthesis protein E3
MPGLRIPGRTIGRQTSNKKSGQCAHFLTMIRPLPLLLKIDQREVMFTRRGFSCVKPQARERLERIGRVFLHGYHSALEQSDQEALVAQFDQINAEHRGFAYEGAAMALTLLDGMTPGGKWKRLSRFVAGPAKRHIYMLYVGAGWACARLPWLRLRVESVIRKFHPVLGWLTLDGYGFHEGYFHWQAGPHHKIFRLSQDARHVFYQGLGRSLWFIAGADVRAIVRTIATFPGEFHNDAWSGVGLGCGYAGGVDRAELVELRRHAGTHRAALAQGAAFAAGARRLAENPAAHTELVCAVFCGVSAERAAALCDQTCEQTTGLSSCPYQKWRELLQKTFSLESAETDAHESLQLSAEPH